MVTMYVVSVDTIALFQSHPRCSGRPEYLVPDPTEGKAYLRYMGKSQQLSSPVPGLGLQQVEEQLLNGRVPKQLSGSEAPGGPWLNSPDISTLRIRIGDERLMLASTVDLYGMGIRYIFS
jgi:hypothetical protein